MSIARKNDLVHHKILLEVSWLQDGTGNQFQQTPDMGLKLVNELGFIVKSTHTKYRCDLSTSFKQNLVNTKMHTQIGIDQRT